MENKKGLISQILFAVAILLFILCAIFIKSSDAIPIIIFYVIILTCLFCATFLLVQSIKNKKIEKQSEKEGDENDTTDNG